MSQLVLLIKRNRGCITIIVQVTDLCKNFGKKNILNNVSFHADKGECISIVGANGCGKSTLLGILSGSQRAASGTIQYGGHTAIKNPRLFSEYVGYVPQDNPLMDKLSVLDNLRFWYCESSRDLKEDLKTGVPARFGLTSYKDYSVEKLSGGMKKRLSIACALAKNPPILILDEPGASLDIVCKEDIKNYLKTYLQNGGTVIITSHEESELDLCDRMYLLQNGILTELSEKLVGPALMERMIASHG